MEQERSFETILRHNLQPEHLKEFNRIYYGREDHCELTLKKSTLLNAEKNNFVVAAYSFPAAREETRSPRLVKIGLVQHSVVLPTDQPIQKQREAIFNKVEKYIQTAAEEGIQILCLQETWSMPFFLGTRERDRWSEFVESAEDGPSVSFLSKLAEKHGMVIVSPILEKDRDGIWWNAAVVIDEKGQIMGKHRKNHLPSVGSFSETSFYSPGNTGHPVFETKFGRIAVNICYGRHQALNWLMFSLNRAEIVFNPSATISEFGESFWGIEARNAAIANSYFTCSINRVGTENFTLQDGVNGVTRSYYGSSYVTAPNGCRTPGLSREQDGLLIAEIDLNLNRQIKDHWGFNMTARLDMYADELIKFKNCLCSILFYPRINELLSKQLKLHVRGTVAVKYLYLSEQKPCLLKYLYYLIAPYCTKNMTKISLQNNIPYLSFSLSVSNTNVLNAKMNLIICLLFLHDSTPQTIDRYEIR